LSGSYTRQGDSLRIGPLAMTRRACVGEELNRQEYAFTQALEAARTWRIAGDTLVLSGDAGPLARLTRATQP
jgi:heat shock protein HslJ